MTQHNQTQAQQIAVKPDLPTEVQVAVLRLLAWNASHNLSDHGYNLSADLRTVLDQFEITVRGPIVPTPPNTAHNEVKGRQK